MQSYMIFFVFKWVCILNYIKYSEEWRTFFSNRLLASELICFIIYSQVICRVDENLLK